MTAAVLLLVLAQPARLPAGALTDAPATPPADPVTFADVVTAARDDAAALPPGVAPLTRYLSAAHLPAAERRELYAVVAYHANAASRESRPAAPRQVTPWLWAVRLDDYRWDAATWEKLKAVNHYFSVRVEVTTPGVKKTRRVVKTDQYGRAYYADEEYTEAGGAKTVDFIPAPWLPPKETAGLIALTGSATPVVRADEWVVQTGIQAGRAGHGYYDWLGLKSRADAEKLAGLDRKLAEGIRRELAAIVINSGVGLNNRQVFRYQTVAGAWWETRDPLTSVGDQNAVSNLLGDFRHDAEEIVFTLPNGLPAYYLSDAKGVQVDSAPDAIASDSRSTNNDHRVHAAMSCVTCHADGGLKPIRDYARKIYGGESGLSLAALALDPEKAKRIEAAYLGPLDRAYRRDLADFGEAITAASGLAPPELARAYQARWSAYLDAPVTLARAAAECGVTPEVLRAALRRQAAARGVVDPVLAVLLLDDADGVPVRREHWEERFPVAMLVLQGANP